ncbi:MAG: PEP-CTERM sorting domain-containing protein [Planctomycetota bacterium]|jgi:hypothetical protein
MKRAAGVKAFLCFIVIITCLCSLPASATIVSFDLSFIFEGPGVPTNPPPWMIATFDDGGTLGTVDLTISAPGLDGDNEKCAGIYFNLDPDLDPTLLAFSDPTKTGTFDDPIINRGANGHKADGDGYYDIRLDFGPDGSTRAFNGGDVVQYTITLASLTANSFDFLSKTGGGTGPFQAAAHLLSLGATQESAWITTPEPATIFLFGLGALTLLRKRK